MPESSGGGTGPASDEIARYQGFLQGEVDGAALYNALADAETDPGRADVLRRLAATEERHAAHWVERLRGAGVSVGEMPRPGMQSRVLGALAKRFGAASVLPIARTLELRDSNIYAGEPAAGNLAADERVHSKTVRALTSTDVGANSAAFGVPGILLRERWHGGRDNGGALRAAIFGVEDGLVSNLSLVMGVAGAGPGSRFVLLSGIAGLLAGAFSMAAGEWVSMTAQRELFERQIALEKAELADHPDEEREELALIYQAKGIPKEEAESLAARLMENPATALDTLSREELGLDPDALGSPWAAAASSLVMFAIGALLPVLPFIFTGGRLAIVLAAVLSAAGLMTIGAAVTLFTGRHPLYSGVRMVLIGAGAATITFVVGRLIGVSVS